LRLKEREQSTGQVTAATTPTTSWKSKLIEHYNKQLGVAGAALKYATVEAEGRGFVSSVFLPKLRREVKGEPRRSKKEAEQNAAEKAFYLLQRS
jgi:dsRNA-specific ribonuclease